MGSTGGSKGRFDLLGGLDVLGRFIMLDGFDALGGIYVLGRLYVLSGLSMGFLSSSISVRDPGRVLMVKSTLVDDYLVNPIQSFLGRFGEK